MPSPSVLVLGALMAPPMVLVTLAVVVLALVVGRVVLALAWRITIAVAVVVLALWLLGAVGLGPI
jgi:hypothetical protein